MVEIKISYEGQLRCKAVHVPSGHSIMTDAPADNMGKAEYFSPTDLVAASFGTCALTVMGIAANKNKIDMSGATATVQKEMATAPSRRVGKLTIVITVPQNLNHEQQRILEAAAKACPVHKSLHHEIEIALTFKWGA